MNNIPIFIINLKKDTNKKQHMETLCEKHNLQCQFTEAVYGKDLDEKSLSKVYNKEESIRVLGRGLSKGEIGCALSHLNIYKHMIDHNIKNAIIFEDDVQLTEDFHSLISNIDQFPSDWELVLLGYYKNCFTEKCSRSSLRDRKKITTSHQTVRLIERAYGTHGYLINLQGAKKLFNQLSVIKKPIDHYTSNEANINLYAIYPRVVRLYKPLSDHSSIEQERKKENDLKVKKPIIVKIKKTPSRLVQQLAKHVYDPIKRLKPYE